MKTFTNYPKQISACSEALGSSRRCIISSAMKFSLPINEEYDIESRCMVLVASFIEISWLETCGVQHLLHQSRLGHHFENDLPAVKVSFTIAKT